MTYAGDIRPITSPIPLSQRRSGVQEVDWSLCPDTELPFLVLVFRRLILTIIRCGSRPGPSSIRFSKAAAVEAGASQLLQIAGIQACT